MRPEITLRIYPLSDGRFEVREQDRALGTSQNEMMAVWSALSAAEEMSRAGRSVRAVTILGDKEIEHFAENPKR